MAVTTISITEARNNFLNLVKNAREILERTVITRNGKPEAVLMSYDEYEGWLETLEISRDTELMDGILGAKKEADGGKLYSFEQVFPSSPKAKYSKRK